MKINLADLLAVCFIEQHGTEEQKVLLENLYGGEPGDGEVG